MPGGQPTLYRPEYCKMVIEHCSKGMSYTSFAAEVDVHVDTLYEWEKVHPEFSEAKKKAQIKLRSWNEKFLLNALMNQKKFGSVWPGLIFKLKNQNKWRDSVALDIEKLPDLKLNYNLND